MMSGTLAATVPTLRITLGRFVEAGLRDAVPDLGQQPLKIEAAFVVRVATLVQRRGPRVARRDRRCLLIELRRVRVARRQDQRPDRGPDQGNESCAHTIDPLTTPSHC